MTKNIPSDVAKLAKKHGLDVSFVIDEFIVSQGGKAIAGDPVARKAVDKAIERIAARASEGIRTPETAPEATGIADVDFEKAETAMAAFIGNVLDHIKNCPVGVTVGELATDIGTTTGNVNIAVNALLHKKMIRSESNNAGTSKLFPVTREDRAKSGIVGQDYHIKYDLNGTGDNNDALARVLRDATRKTLEDGKTVRTDLDAIRRIAEDNALDYSKFSSRNAGGQRMVLSNLLRGKLRKGEAVKIDDKVIETLS